MKCLRMILILLLSLGLTTSCDKPNSLTEYSKTDTDEALYLEAKKKMDAADWDGAITIFTTTLSADYRSQTKVRENLMHAYGGKCGISFFEMVNKLKNVSSSLMFEVVLQIYSMQVVDVEACDNAIETLFSLGSTAATRTNSQNLFAAILGLTRMGTTLRSKIDTDNGGLGNGEPDPGGDYCTDSTAANRLSDDEVNRVVTGMGLLFENLSALGDELTSGSAGSAFDAAKTLCEAPIALPAIAPANTYDPSLTAWEDYGLPASPTYQDLGLPSDIEEPLNCMVTDNVQVSAKMRRLFRRMIASTQMGYNTCDLTNMDLEVVMPTILEPTPSLTVVANCCPAMVAP